MSKISTETWLVSPLLPTFNRDSNQDQKQYEFPREHWIALMYSGGKIVAVVIYVSGDYILFTYIRTFDLWGRGGVYKLNFTTTKLNKTFETGPRSLYWTSKLTSAPVFSNLIFSLGDTTEYPACCYSCYSLMRSHQEIHQNMGKSLRESLLTQLFRNSFLSSK